MELDHLKELWQQQEPEKVSGNLRQFLGKKSNGPIAKMKRNLLYELIVVIITYGVATIYFFTAFAGRMNTLAWVYLILAVIFIVYFIMKNKLLNEMECMACQVKSNLSRQVATLEKYVRYYLIVGTAVFPLFVLYTYFILIPEVRFIRGSDNLSEKGLTFFWLSTVWVISTIVLTIIVYNLNKCYVNKLYGKHIKKLKLMLEQMED